MHYIKQSIVILLACVLTASSFLYGMYQTPQQQAIARQLRERRNRKNQIPKTHGLLLFLDNTESLEKNPSAIMFSFAQAIFEKAGPIIATASVVQGLTIKKTTYNVDFFDKLNSAYEHELISDEKYWPLRYKIGFSLIGFNAQDWIIKGVDNSYSHYLLIPKTYLQAKGIKPEDVASVTTKKELTATELTLGLKVNHMHTVVKPSSYVLTPTDPLRVLWDANANKSAVFVINEEYKAYPTIKPPQWALYINGHGRKGEIVVGAPLDAFRVFLTFLERKIKTLLLYYNSCYAAGLTNKKLYEDAEQAITRTYPFVIITQALTDAAVSSEVQKIKSANGILSLSPSTMFKTFFKEVEGSDSVDYRAVAKALLYDVIPGEVGWSLPQVKLPGVEWFSVIDTNKAVTIGDVMAQARKDPLDIATFFRSHGKNVNPYAILLYAPEIPFELIINTPKVPAIVSMIPGKAHHEIKKISSASHSVKSLIGSFLTMSALTVEKEFVIEELVGINRGFISTAPDGLITLKNVSVSLWYNSETEKDAYEVSFEYDNNKYLLDDFSPNSPIEHID